MAVEGVLTEDLRCRNLFWCFIFVWFISCVLSPCCSFFFFF